ncbi:DUF975 family protein [Cellulosilyticum ruminicola]|uniref:DUF975 family protein n=1 Tax=Cellulosilyticum ruminicola TaxID=425254 RepID=UPI0006CF5686|nr:DUF975 family protein [Cellulosilyticum ruminicola]
MWTRADLKESAKAVLKTNYWQAFVVALVIFLIGVDGSNGGNSSGWRFWGNKSYLENTKIVFMLFCIGIIAVAVRIFVGYMLEVGGRKFFIRAAEGESQMSYLGYVFKEGAYWNVFKAMFYRGILVFLWTLLLIIPGIVKGYAYSMVPYILADNPNMDYKRAKELSNQMTMGQKMDMWVLDLSFIGWYLLGAIAFGIGVVFVNPYCYATKAELYKVLREEAVKKGYCTFWELNMTY